MDDQADELLADQKEDAAELAGLRARNHELRHEVELLRRSGIDLRGQLAEEQARSS